MLPERNKGITMARTARLKTLTAAGVKSYIDSPERTTPLHDGGGLYLRKRDASARWYLRMTDPATGSQQWHLLFADDPAGGYPHKGLATARAEADRLRSTRSQGLDPRKEREREIRERAETEAVQLAAQRRLTVSQLFERWQATDLAPTTRADGRRTGRKDGGEYVAQQFRRHVFPTLGTNIAETLRKSDLLGVIDTQKARGQLRTASVLLSDLRQMLDFAVDRDLIPANPLASLKKARIVGTAVERDRVLSEQEISQLAASLPRARLSQRSEAAIWLTLATGARVGEVMGAIWSNALPDERRAHDGRLGALQAIANADEVKIGVVDLAARRWYLPDTKNQRDHTIHLSEFAAAQFATLMELREALPLTSELSPWVFPARDASRPVCVKSFGKQLADRQREPEQRMSGRSKNTDALTLPGGRWTAHDLRRTAGTLMAGLGISGDVIDECLNHMIESRVRRIYVRDRREADQARAFDALGARLAAIVNGETTAGNVIALRTA